MIKIIHERKCQIIIFFKFFLSDFYFNGNFIMINFADVLQKYLIFSFFFFYL
jgi:hypothetical protein